MRIKLSFVGQVSLLLMFAVFNFETSGRAQGTAFTYQGRLNSGASPVNGHYDFQFTLYDDTNLTSSVTAPDTISAVAVSNGLFTVTLDFGDPDTFQIFDGQQIWLGIGVRTNGAADTNFTQLSPFQFVTPTPYAITAGNLNGTLPSQALTGTYSSAVTLNNAANHVSGTFTGNGAGVTNVNASKLGGVPVSGFWQTGGNLGTVPGANILGSLDNQPLELWVNGNRAIQIVPTTNTANLIGGSIINVTDPNVVGATIAGGGGNYLGSGYPNYVRGSYGSIGGGVGNTASNVFSTIAGGYRNTASGYGAFIGGGGYDSNPLFYVPSLIGNSASGTASVIGGGIGNTASGNYGVVGGGFSNTASGFGSFVGGGGIDGIDLAFAVNVYGNTASGISSTIGGGVGNFATDQYTTVGGGTHNQATSLWATVCGGQSNVASGFGAFVGGGGAINGVLDGNTASGQASTVCGGINNIAAGDGSFAAGWGAHAMHAGSFVWSDGSGVTSTQPRQFLIKASGGVGIGTAAPESSLHVAGSSITLGTSAVAGGYTALKLGLSAVQNGYANIQAISQSGSTFGNLILQANGGFVGIGKTNPITTLDVAGPVSGTVFINSSDRNLKEHVLPVSPREVLDKVTAMPISRWNFISDPATAHLGPMAQDFHAAFGLGMDDKHIATVDEEGVALAAIQGLSEKVEEKNARINEQEATLQDLAAAMKAQHAENVELKARLDRLEKMLATRNTSDQ